MPTFSCKPYRTKASRARHSRATSSRFGRSRNFCPIIGHESPRERDSPYLQQHADNPVDWYPWGDEALALARARGQADPAVDRLLGVPLVPRDGARVVRGPGGRRGDERALRQHQGRSRGAARPRPDLPDRARAAHAAHRRLAADDVPDAGRASRSSAARTSRSTALRAARLSRPAAARRATRIASRATSIAEQSEAPGRRAGVARAREASRRRRCPRARPAMRSARLKRSFDAVHGGFGGAPKFPHPAELEFCLRAYGTTRRLAKRSRIVRTTLAGWPTAASTISSAAASAATSVDAEWTIPHFEKMLYDNGPLLGAVRGSRARDRRCQRSRTSRAASSGWLDARDARGRRRVLLEPRCRQRRRGRQVLRLDAATKSRALLTRRRMGGRAHRTTASTAAELRRPRVEPARRRAARARRRPARRSRCPTRRRASSAPRAALFAAREKRVRPGLDDKILTSWNALAIAGLARASRALDEPRMGRPRVRRRSTRCAAPRGATGGCSRRASGERAQLNAYLDDHAFLLDGLIELMQTRFRREDFDLGARDRRRAARAVRGSRARRLLVHEPRSRGAVPSHQARATTTRRRRATASRRRR